MKIAFIIIIIHFIADFIYQDEKWAIGKSKNWKDLLSHTFTYSYIWFILIVFLFPRGWTIHNYIINCCLFAIITFVTHTITDYFTSRIVSNLRVKGKFGSRIPNLGFFTMIGFDQVLHYGQLFLTFHILSNTIWG